MKLQLVQQLKLKAVSTFALEILCYLTLDFTLTSVKNSLTVFRVERRATLAGFKNRIFKWLDHFIMFHPLSVFQSCSFLTILNRFVNVITPRGLQLILEFMQCHLNGT